MSANWFIAVAVPAGEWWEHIPPPPPGVRVFGRDDLHVTVAFLGPCGMEAAEAAFAAAPRWPAGTIDVVLGPVQAMGNPRRPSALSAIVSDGAGELSQAIASVREEMWNLAGARHDERPPLPHATIARPKRSAGKAERAAAMEWARGIDLGRPRVALSRLVLFTHAEDRSVRLFREHAVWNFGAAAHQTKSIRSHPSH